MHGVCAERRSTEAEKRGAASPAFPNYVPRARARARAHHYYYYGRFPSAVNYMP
jgi:hypothetical protein